MKQQALSTFDITWLPLTGLVIFVTCFTLYAYWKFKKENKPFYEAASKIPLEDN
jgi:cbb3-type cytochrome oxidase subunit 3